MVSGYTTIIIMIIIILLLGCRMYKCKNIIIIVGLSDFMMMM